MKTSIQMKKCPVLNKTSFPSLLYKALGCYGIEVAKDGNEYTVLGYLREK